MVLTALCLACGDDMSLDDAAIDDAARDGNAGDAPFQDDASLPDTSVPDTSLPDASVDATVVDGSEPDASNDAAADSDIADSETDAADADPNADAGAADSGNVDSGPDPADIVVTQVTCLPDLVAPGASINCMVTMSNIGGSATGEFQGQLRLSSDTTIDTSDLLLASCNVGDIAPNASVMLQCMATIPGSSADGNYSIGWLADAALQVAELDESNNIGLDGLAINTPDPADIVVQSLTCMPTLLGPGTPLQCSAMVMNAGMTDTGPFTNELRLSADATIEGSDPLMASCAASSIPPGTMTTIECTGPIPVSTTNGMFVAGVLADATNIVPESNEMNNVGSVAIAVENRSDLTITSLSCPDSAIANEVSSCSVTIENQGPVSSAAGFDISMWLSANNTITGSALEITEGTCTTAPLAAQASRTVACNIRIPTAALPGAAFLGAVVDGANAIIESNETNNNTVEAVTILGLPDLEVTSVDCPDPLAAGQAVECDITLANTGDAASPVFTYELRFSANSTISSEDVLIGSCNTATLLAAGDSVAVTCPLLLPITTSAGPGFIGAVADGANAVQESDEANNTGAAQISAVAAGPDIVVETLNCPSEIARGYPTSCDLVFRNQGAVSSPNFSYEIRLSTNNTITGSDILLGTCTETAIAPGATNNDSCTVTIPAGVLPTDYFIGVQADSADEVTETFEDNNTATNPVTVVALPDLEIRNESCAFVDDVAAGEHFECTFSIRNSGTASISNYTIGMYLSGNSIITPNDTSIGECAYDLPLAANQTRNVTCSLGQIPMDQPLGPIFVGAVADEPATAIAEESETNNGSDGIAINIVSSGAPDLDVISVSCPPDVNVGETLVCSTTIANIGSSAAGPSTAELRLSVNSTISTQDALLGTCSIGPLVVGQRQTRNCSGVIPGTAGAGPAFGGIIADSSDGVPESNENNNTGADPITIQM